MEIYKAKDFSELLILIGTSARQGRVGLYARLARSLKLKSPRTVAMVIKKQRPPSAGLVKSILELRSFTPMEQSYVHLLAERSRLDLKGCYLDKIDRKIERYQRMQKIEISEKVHFNGVLVEFSPDTNSEVRKKVLECLKELMVDEKG